VNNSTLIGHCVLTNIHWTYRTAEFGIYIGDKAGRGFGWGTEALKLLLTYGFDVLNLNKVWGEVYDDNPALKIFEKLGFKQECIMKQARFMHGKYCDIFVIGMLKGEWGELDE